MQQTAILGWLDTLGSFMSTLSSWIWGLPLLVLLFGTHLYLTFRLRFIQKYIGTAIKLSLRRTSEGTGDVSQFGALTTALAATIGTGNIVGVATAVAAGGPGAVFWMWLTGVFGIATKYAEALLAVRYRVMTPSGQMAGGPMYALERGLRERWGRLASILAVIFAAFTAIAAFGIGNMVQANSISEMLRAGYSIPAWFSGIVMTILTAVVILGGIKSIARVCEKLVPFMAFFYVAGCLILLAMKWQTIGESFLLIVSSAFSGHAALGGFLGAGIKEAARFGIARGLFSNESGLGSAPIVAAAAQTKNPVRQALVSSTGTFWDTVVVCAITGLVIVNSGDWANPQCRIDRLTSPHRATLEKAKLITSSGKIELSRLSIEQKTEIAVEGGFDTIKIDMEKLSAVLAAKLNQAGIQAETLNSFDNVPENLRRELATSDVWRPLAPKGAELTKAAFAEIPVIGPLVLAIGLLTFVFSTILGWSYYGEKAIEYLFGSGAIRPYRYAWVVAVMLGSVLKLNIVWDFADAANGMMAVPNLISLLALSSIIVGDTRKYLWEGNLDAEVRLDSKLEE
ncbi:MAG TPA: sodium:alanine symporter family protein [Candidatus Ozemobacteraceae bacterium]|nr:sodium:alanine symporter family protein [Candidatus Ozemobacteraceae bacterium]